mmetsp:Transcript_98209/g.194532  ORF Transcript_98209/g.194532 Transcript_98209/m.194532 type:complete len:88 (+) Transcript_98209:88-351(+)
MSFKAGLKMRFHILLVVAQELPSTCGKTTFVYVSARQNISNYTLCGGAENRTLIWHHLCICEKCNVHIQLDAAKHTCLYNGGTSPHP